MKGMRVRRYNKFIVFLFISFMFFGCKSKSDYHINLHHIDLQIEINRFDRELCLLNKINYESQLQEIAEKYPGMFRVFVEQLARAGKIEDSVYVDRLHTFFFDKYTQELYSDCQLKFSKLDKIEEDIENAYKHIHYYYPDQEIPEFYSIISNFGVAAASFEHIIMFSLDYYLGADYHYYDDLFPKYKSNRFREEYICSDIMKVQFGEIYPEEEYSGNTLLSNMIYLGKKLFFMELMLPETADSIKVGYRKEELKWCEKNEGKIWNQILLSNVLYETQTLKISRYIDDGPFTNAYGIPSDSPARLGEWLGWQIVQKYIETKKIKNYIELFEEKDAQKILMESGYKPKP